MGIDEFSPSNWIQSWFQLEFIAHGISAIITAKSHYKGHKLFKLRFKVFHSFKKATVIRVYYLEAIRLNYTFTFLLKVDFLDWKKMLDSMVMKQY